MTEKINKLFPKKVINALLRLHKQWNHHDWLSMIDKLTERSFHQWRVYLAGQKKISFYLETNRR